MEEDGAIEDEGLVLGNTEEDGAIEGGKEGIVLGDTEEDGAIEGGGEGLVVIDENAEVDSDTEEDGAIEGGGEGLVVIDGNTEVDGELLFVSVGEELGAVLLDGAFEATTTMTIGSTTGSPESNDPMIIADIATKTNIRKRRNLILRCFHQGRGGSTGSPM